MSGIPFTESNIRSWLHNCVYYSIGLYYIPSESWRHWDGYFIDEIQEDSPKYKNLLRNFVLIGDFNAPTGTQDDSLQPEVEINHI